MIIKPVVNVKLLDLLDLYALKYFCDIRVYLKIFKEKQLNLWYL